MTTQPETTRKIHRRAVRFFWCLLIGATMVSLLGNIAHAALPFIPRVAIQIGAAAVPPIVLLTAVHGIALAVRAGASGPVYRSAVSAVALIGVGAFTVSFLSLRDLMHSIGYGSATAWIFPAIIDTAVAVSTVMLIALGDKPAPRLRNVSASPRVQTTATQRSGSTRVRSANSQATGVESSMRAHPVQVRKQGVVSARPASPRANLGSAEAVARQADASLAADMIASGATKQPVETVIAVLSACRDGQSTNAAAVASGINYRTAQRIVEAASEHQRLLAVG